MPRPIRKVRNIRVEDELWAAAQAKCETEGLVLSEEIRAFLTRFTRPPRNRG